MSGASVTLRRCVDAWVDSDAGSRNQSDGRRLSLQAAGSATAYAYLHFGWRVPLGVNVVSATLRLRTASAWGAGSSTLTVRRVADQWRASRVTWDTRPGVITSGAGQSASLAKVSNAVDDEWVVDVTALVQAVADGARWRGLRVETSSTSRRDLWSADEGDNDGGVSRAPVLEIAWSEAPDAPSALSPSGGRAVSLAKPVLRCDFTDDQGSTAMQAIQVQVNATNTWSSPSFDSGTVATTEPELDLSATAYAGLSAGSSAWWRVRVQDGAGLWSPWSDAAQFRRDNKGALGITNPAAPPDNFVSEWTPPLTWSLTGETQKAWQVTLTRPARPDRVVYDSGRVPGVATSHTLPRDVIEDDESYQLTVRVWDSKDREHTPGDATWTQATRLFTFNEDATVNPVTSLVVSVATEPDVILTWSRSTMPDRFSILRNGRVIASDLVAADLFTTGTAYAYRDFNPPPRRPLTYEVQATVNGKTSAGNPSVTTQTAPRAIWLAHPEHEHRRVCVVPAPGAGRTASDITMGETAGTYAPVTVSRTLRVTQSLRGYEGSISGILTGHAGKTTAEWQERLFQLKERPDEPLILSLGDDAFPVLIGNVVTAPVSDTPDTRPVSFDFWQVGRLPFDARV